MKNNQTGEKKNLGMFLTLEDRLLVVFPNRKVDISKNQDIQTFRL